MGLSKHWMWLEGKWYYGWIWPIPSDISFWIVDIRDLWYFDLRSLHDTNPNVKDISIINEWKEHFQYSILFRRIWIVSLPASEYTHSGYQMNAHLHQYLCSGYINCSTNYNNSTHKHYQWSPPLFQACLQSPPGSHLWGKCEQRDSNTWYILQSPRF